MVRKIFFGVTLFVLSVLLANPVSAAEVDIDYSAELDKVCKPSHCVVPVPTLVDPNEKIIKIDENFYLIGLTWNNTKIDIYVDNEYQGKAIVVNDDDSDTANFYYLVENHLLLEGQHEWKVIAWTENMRKRSYISVENKFIIEDYFIAPHLNNITSDIDGNNWLIGSAENNSLVSIYVDNVYKGQVRTDGNFNYNIGPLSPGLHTFYALTKEVDTNKTSKRSNILSEQVMETQIIAEEVIEEEPVLEPEEEVIPEPIEEELIEPEVIEEEPILEPEEVEITEEENISSISEENNSEDDIIIQSEEDDTNVNVTETENSDIEVEIISDEESQDQLVVDNQKSELETVEAINEEETTATEELQSATPSMEEEQMIMEELNIVDKQERNRKVGLFLLVILIVIVVASTFVSGKKSKKIGDIKKDEKDDSHQGNLFNGE